MSKGARHLEATETLQQIAEFLPGTPCVLTNFSLLRPARTDVVRIERTEDRGISISTILRLIKATNRQTAKPTKPALSVVQCVTQVFLSCFCCWTSCEIMLATGAKHLT